MARTYNKSGTAKEVKAAEAPQVRKTPTEKHASHTSNETPSPAKQETAKSVIASPDKKVMQQIVYQPSAQILTRDVAPNESFGVGDDMPIYYL